MNLFTRHDLNELLKEHVSPCVSLFMPTHRGGSQQDPIRWRKQLAEAEEQLVHDGWRSSEVRKMLEPARQMLEDPTFWRNQGDGLAGFVAPDFMRVFRLPMSFTDAITVGNAFSILPLLPLLSGDGGFFVLAFSQNAVRLLQGSRDNIHEIELEAMPHGMAEALVSHDTDEPLTYHTRRTSGGTWAAIFEGHGVGIDDFKDDLLLYFQQVDRALHPLLRQEKSPLVLASVDYLQPIYRQANTYSHLVDRGIHGNPDRLSDQQLHDLAWRIVSPLFQKARQDAEARYRELAFTEHASANPEAIVTAAYQGRVETLFVAQDQHLWGILDPATGHVERHPERSLGDVNLLDLAAAHTLKHGGTVYAGPHKELPGRKELAAFYWLTPPKHGQRP
jgi:hypothetical protein